MNRKIYFSALILTLALLPLDAQKLEPTAIKAMVEKYKADQRGPYKDIRWYCKDGSVIPPKEKCPQPGGVQRARYKDEVVALAKSNHVFLGQILSTTDKAAFWDVDNNYSRLKQYQLEAYLKLVDDGWVLKKGQFYRGAFQAEDEEAWGIDFFNWLLPNDPILHQQFFLARQAAKTLPHQGDDRRTQNIRALSKVVAEAYPAFENLRVKIHGQPEVGDLSNVKAFKAQHQNKIPGSAMGKLDELISEMEIFYQPIDLKELNKYILRLPKDAQITEKLNDYVLQHSSNTNSIARVMATAEIIWEIRSAILSVKSAKARLALLDISISLEELYFREIENWESKTPEDLLNKICYTGTVAAGTGLLETWEWENIRGELEVPMQKTTSLQRLNQYLDQSRNLVEWGTGMVRGTYQDVINLYGTFEPLAFGFYDDQIRSSVLLNLGQSIGILGDFIAEKGQLANQVLNIPNQSTIRGLNPGLAMGELVVVTGSEEEVEVEKDKIYVFQRPPYDLKPVAGIATVTEGNVVSHVQLLARNLGIPNAVISNQNLQDLNRFNGRRVFYAVSNKGTVILKLAESMSPEEKELFSVKTRKEEKISVPVEKIDLGQTSILNMRSVNATSSGKLCGPKAANLGQLKLMFPDNVVEGLVIPFGIFRKHLDQQMPNETVSYWTYLNEAFQQAATMKVDGKNETAIEAYLLEEMEKLRVAIKQIELSPEFVADLNQSFSAVFGKKMGEIPVFLRSDTNMEDLKDFTGAGLNLTLFNVVTADKIIQGIKDVWASPYTERSFKWRQRYLLNPENVFPSILIIPSVDVDYSGVLITKGIATGDSRDLTIAFNRGAGGAVDGQAAESYLLRHTGETQLLSPAREPSYRSLPESGGTKTNWTNFYQPILNPDNLYRIRLLAIEVNEKLPKAPGVETTGPFDVELGFKDDKLWLFQVRPFVENKNALSSSYLESITPNIPGDKMINILSDL